MGGIGTVYTVHKFIAENPDEISINVGEPIVVLEKDEGYNDGWWQGRNIKGEVGLFPITYTSSKPVMLSKSIDTKIDSLETDISNIKILNKASTNSLSSLNTVTTSNSLTSSKPISVNTPPLSINASPIPTHSMSTPTSSKKTKPYVFSPKENSPSKNIQLVINLSLDNPELGGKPVEEWTSDMVSQWLIEIGFDRETANNFKDQEITGDILLELTLESLKELQINTFGKRFKLHNFINVLKTETQRQKRDETRVNSLFTEQNGLKNGVPSYYGNNYSQVEDDDNVSDYSTIIRHSTIKSNDQRIRPSLPLDMNLIASSPRLSTLVEMQASQVNDRKMSAAKLQQQQQWEQQQQQLERQHQQFHEQQQLELLQQRQKQYQEQQALIQRKNNIPDRSDWKNSIKMNETPSTRFSTNSRYSFMKSSLLPSSNRLQSILPYSPSPRKSEDAISLAEISTLSDMDGWLYKQGDKYRTWNKRWFVLKSNNLFYFKSPKAVRMKGIINLKGYRIELDESIHLGKYCFKAHHERERTFYFYTEQEKDMKDWIKALMKATIARDFNTPVMSSNNIPTVSLEAARKMRPRPPSTIFQPNSNRASKNVYQPENQFSMTSIDEHTSSIIPLSLPQKILQQNAINSSVFRSNSLNSQRIPISVLNRKQGSVSSDNASIRSYDQGSKFKDSGFTSALGGIGSGLSRSIHTDTSSHSSSSGINHSDIITTNNTSNTLSIIFSPEDEEEDLIDPEHTSVMDTNKNPSGYHRPEIEEKKRAEERERLKRNQHKYVEWINMQVQNHKITCLSDLSTGTVLLELLEVLSNKDIGSENIISGSSLTTRIMDRLVLAFKFMGNEGLDLDCGCSMRGKVKLK
ncbi:hypothetical protein BDB01DRAFT_774918 [Pilobolus umbonatus]|nr:hypothetical protein BDB01DRAFT_774918 [Pilobolus umbonatus]